MSNGLACSYGWRVECLGEIPRPECRHGMPLLAKSNCRWSHEEHIDATHPRWLATHPRWLDTRQRWLGNTKHGHYEFLKFHCPAGRPSHQRRRFRRHDRQRILVVLVRLVCVRCREPRPGLQPQRHLPQRLQPCQRLIGSLLQGLGMC